MYYFCGRLELQNLLIAIVKYYFCRLCCTKEFVNVSKTTQIQIIFNHFWHFLNKRDRSVAHYLASLVLTPSSLCLSQI